MLLIDDIYTTGATAKSATQTLNQWNWSFRIVAVASTLQPEHPQLKNPR
ncbi:hypothetical protein AB0758_44925 [Tolypothrix bouteillei VB521301_2]